MSRPRTLSHLLSLVLVTGSLVAVTTAPAGATDPATQALARLDRDADRALTVRETADGTAAFIGVPARAEVDNPAVEESTTPGAAGDAAIARYGAAVGTAQPGTTVERTDVQDTATGDVVRYQQEVGGVPVLGGEIVVSLREDSELSSILADTSDETSVATATVGESAAAELARTAFLKSAGVGAGSTVESLGRWVLDAGLIGGDGSGGARTVWRFEISRHPDERRQVLVDDRTGAVLMNIDEIQHAVDRVVCDNRNVRRANEVPCTSGFARTEGGSASRVADVNTAYNLSGVVADFYQQVAGVDLTQLLGITVGGQPKLASTVRWCLTDTSEKCPYDNAFWDGSQMYYGAGYAGADDVVGHEMTHGFTERTSNLLYWGQSGAMNESISDIVGEIIDHRNPSTGDSATSWTIGEDIPGFSNGFRDMKDPTLRGDPDKTSSSLYASPESCPDPDDPATCYPDSDGVHTDSGVGNKTFYLISQGGTFNGHTIAGIDVGDASLSKSARLWLLVDQSLSSGSDWADEAAVLDQSCQALVAGSVAGFTADDCTQVHEATLATELRLSPIKNPQPVDATETCPGGAEPQELFDSETGNPATKVTAGSTWGRTEALAHSGSSWFSDEPRTAGASSLTAKSGVALPAGQASYLIFDRWHVLEYDSVGFYDALTVQVNNTDAAALPWVNGPTNKIWSGQGNPAAGRKGFGGDSRGYVTSRLDLTSYAGSTVKPQFTMTTDASLSVGGASLDDIVIYTCDPQLTSSTEPTVSGTPHIGETLTALPGTWTPVDGLAFAYQWYRGTVPIAGATGADYVLKAADVGSTVKVLVTASASGFGYGSALSAAVGPVVGHPMTRGTPSISGTALQGRTLTMSPGSWEPAAVTLSRQWLRDGAPIPGATRTSYLLGSADVGAVVSVRVTGKLLGYEGTSTTSAGTAKVVGVVKSTRPRIAGTATVGKKLVARPGTWSPRSVAFGYVWLRNGRAIPGAKGASYTLIRADQGKRVSVRVTGRKTGYRAATATSTPTAKVRPKPRKRR